MGRMDWGTEHALRSELARMREREVMDAYAEAKSAGDRERQRVIEDDMERRGLEA